MSVMTTVNCQTGQRVRRPLTALEIQQMEADADICDAALAVDESTLVNGSTLRDRAAAALGSNRTYLAIASPTAADMRQQLELVTRQNQALIRLVVGLLNDDD